MPKGSFTCTMEIRNIITRIWWFKENFVYPELKITPQEIGLYVYTVGFFAFISKKNNLVYVWILSIYIKRPKNTSTEHVSIILINHIFLILIWIRWLLRMVRRNICVWMKSMNDMSILLLCLDNLQESSNHYYNVCSISKW